MRGKFGVSTPGGREVQFKIFVIPVLSLARLGVRFHPNLGSHLVTCHVSGQKPTDSIFWCSDLFIGTPFQILIWALLPHIKESIKDWRYPSELSLFSRPTYIPGSNFSFEISPQITSCLASEGFPICPRDMYLTPIIWPNPLATPHEGMRG
jgi:hypothetical protein